MSDEDPEDYRSRRHRIARVDEGWKKVAVWVPTDEGAVAVKEFAAKLRAKAKSLEDLMEIPNVNQETAHRIAAAVAEHGSRAYTVASGAVIELMSQLCEEDNLSGVSMAYIVLARAVPSSAPIVASSVPAKISNFLVRHRDVDARMFLDWTAKNPEWAESLKKTVRNPDQFTAAVNEMAEDIKKLH